MLVTIGIATDGRPVISRDGAGRGLTRVRNVAIGLGFHWQRTIECDFPGEIRRNPDPDSPYTLLNTLPLETYLECVVGSEMNPSAPPEFLRAHAIISRSWAAGKIQHRHPGTSGEANTIAADCASDCDCKDMVATDGHRVIIGWEDTSDHEGFHLCGDDHCQRYQGVQPLSAEARDAIRATAGLVLTGPSGQIVDARFSKCCGGRTELFSTCWQAGTGAECLESFEDPWCDLSSFSAESRERLLSSILKDYDRGTEGGYRWETVICGDELRERLRQRHGVDIGEITDLEPLHRGPSGRIFLLRLHGSRGILDIGKELYIRRLLSADCLYSSAFEVEKEEGPRSGFRLRGQGWGHGVGLCQTGAARMAAAGHGFMEILRFYYPGTEICSLDALVGG
ncbi:MAG: SpoIID/LytB domain-containing protein [Muribaculaceae bacterium]|nr:SpoIID/LytB domain-containing protein [Muribaculaceae bacterium]